MARAGNGLTENKAKGASKEKGGEAKAPPAEAIDSERKESEVVSVLRKRIRNLNKKLKKVEETEAAKASGASLNKDQVGLTNPFTSDDFLVSFHSIDVWVLLFTCAGVGWAITNTSDSTNALLGRCAAPLRRRRHLACNLKMEAVILVNHNHPSGFSEAVVVRVVFLERVR